MKEKCLLALSREEAILVLFGLVSSRTLNFASVIQELEGETFVLRGDRDAYIATAQLAKALASIIDQDEEQFFVSLRTVTNDISRTIHEWVAAHSGDLESTSPNPSPSGDTSTQE